MPDQKKILITDRLSAEALITLQSQPFLQVTQAKTPDLKDEDLSQVAAMIIRSRTKIDQELLKRAPKLQLLITATSGFDHIDLESAKDWGVTVMFTPKANVESAAQLTWGLILSCANQLQQVHRDVKAGEWRKPNMIGFEVHNKILGIVGLGRIGKRVAEIGQAFGMNVIAYDPYIDEQEFRSSGVERVAYEEILKRSDVLTFHVPKTAETHRMLDRSHFDYINRGIILINASRGSVINEQDLVEALDKNWLSSVGLDVFEKEPLNRNSKLLQFGNVCLTPHIGANTNDAFSKASEQAALKLIRFFIDGSTEDTLPPKAPWYGAQGQFMNSNP